VWLIVGFCSSLNLIAIGSTETIDSIFNLTAPCLDLSYAAVIFAKQFYSRQVPFVPGPFTLGKWGALVNWFSIIYVLTISVVLYFPPQRPITLSNMNYAIVITVAVGAFGLFWWYASARQ
jgi:Amino acid permease